MHRCTDIDATGVVMLFKVKDLLVSLIPGAEGCEPDSRCNGCTNQYSDCPGGCSNARSDFSENCPQWRYDDEDLADLQLLVRYAQARLEVAQIEAMLERNALSDLDGSEKRLVAAVEKVEHVLPDLPASRDGYVPLSPAFRVNDLLVTVLPPTIADDAGSGCPGCTCAAGCSGGASGCTNASTHIDEINWSVQVLPELQVMLGAALGRVDRTPVGEAMEAHTQGEAERLLEGLKSAADALANYRG